MLTQPQCITWPCDPIEIGGNVYNPIPVPTTTRVPGTVGGKYPVPTTIPSDPYAANGTASPVILHASDAPVFSATTSELDRYRLLFLIIGIAVGYYLLKR